MVGHSLWTATGGLASWFCKFYRSKILFVHDLSYAACEVICCVCFGLFCELSICVYFFYTFVTYGHFL
jgi:hypothetical protein